MLKSLQRRRGSVLLATTALASGLLPLACSEKTSEPRVMVVASDAVLPLNNSVTQALNGQTFSFPSGAAVLSPSLAGQTFAVTFNNAGGNATTATFTLTSASGAALGSFTASASLASASVGGIDASGAIRGSLAANAAAGCSFTVSAIAGTSGLRVGDVITLNPCNANVATAGAVANGVATTRSVALVLGAAFSANTPVTVGITPGGQLTLNGTTVGAVTLVPLSGSAGK